jgi:lipopolysaccharide export system permease protein
VDTSLVQTIDASITDNEYVSVINRALNQSKLLNNTLQINASKLEKLNSDINKHEYESLKKIAQAVSCLIMFLIGAPLGAIIKRGGLGVPVLISICFFIAFYVLTEISRKWADDLLMNAEMAVWFPNLVLLPFGIVFLLQARQDTRLLEMDFYNVWIERAKEKLTLLKRKMPV